jgi:oxazoline/thiazoline synthase
MANAGAVARPRFRKSIRAVVHPDDGLFLLGEHEQRWLPSAVYAALAPLLDGRHEIEEIFDRLVEDYAAADILAALDHLRASGCLAEDAPDPGLSAGFWEQLGVPAGIALERLARTRVELRTLGDIDARAFERLAGRQGVRLDDAGNVAVVLTDDYLRPELGDWNREWLETGRPWLLVRPVGLETWLGPTFVPAATACWECLAQRLRAHRRLDAYLERFAGRGAALRPSPARLESTLHAALADAATAMVRWIATGDATMSRDVIVSTNTLTLRRERHRLVRRPQCSACGAPVSGNARTAPDPRLRARPKLALVDGAYRACDPREFAERLETHLSPVTGIVSRLTPGERSGREASAACWLTPTFSADHNFRDMHDARYFLREGMRRRSGGKGRTPEQARISALAESIERYSGVFDGSEPRLRSTFTALAPHAIHPNDCAGYSARQYAARARQAAGVHKARWVPEPFREDVEIDWTPLWSLTTGETRYLPTACCYFGYDGSGPVFARADSNGCAAGAVLEEAVLQGMLELIERDAVAIWWYNRLRRPGIDMDAFEDPYAGALRDHYRARSRDLWALDVTSDFGIPTIAALSRRVDGDAEDVIYGFGAHLDPRVALSRALTELNQSLEAVPDPAGPPPWRTYRGDEEAVRWWRTVRTAAAPYLSPDRGVRERRPADFADLSADDVRDDVLGCVRAAAARGIEVLMLDQTRPDVGIPVARVVAPGLRHFWARFGPGRLYDVPVRQGWLDRPRDEGEMNPFVIHF